MKTLSLFVMDSILSESRTIHLNKSYLWGGIQKVSLINHDDMSSYDARDS